MPSLREQLIWKALIAIDEVAERAASAPVVPSFALRFTLAFLHASAETPERWMYDNFWRDIQRPTPPGGRCARAMEATTGLHGIMRSVGVIPTQAVLTRLTEHRRRNTSQAVAERRLAKAVRDERVLRKETEERRRSDCGWL